MHRIVADEQTLSAFESGDVAKRKINVAKVNNQLRTYASSRAGASPRSGPPIG